MAPTRTPGNAHAGKYGVRILLDPELPYISCSTGTHSDRAAGLSLSDAPIALKDKIYLGTYPPQNKGLRIFPRPFEEGKPTWQLLANIKMEQLHLCPAPLIYAINIAP